MRPRLHPAYRARWCASGACGPAKNPPTPENAAESGTPPPRSRSGAAPTWRADGDGLAVVCDQVFQAGSQGLVQGCVTGDHIRFQVQGQAQGVQVAGTHGGPVVIHHGHLAVQRALAIFMDLHARAHQVVVQHGAGQAGHRHVRLALKQEPHAHAAPRGLGQFSQQAVSGKEIGVGDQHILLGRTQAGAVVAFNVGGVLDVVAHHQPAAAVAFRHGVFRGAPPSARAGAVQCSSCVVRNINGKRPLYSYGVVLLGLRPEVGQVVRRIVDAAHEGAHPIHGHDLAVHAAEHVGAHAQEPGARIKYVYAHAAVRHGADEFRGQLVRAVAVHQQVYADSALGGRNQRLLQCLADFVVEQNESFNQHFFLRAINGAVDGRKIRLAVFQQGVAVAFPPSKVHRVHSAISAEIGTWSDKRDHTREASGTGRQSRTLRT
jgi:hypothetical protein